MSRPNECWFNVYRSGKRGMSHPTRGQCEDAGFPTHFEQPESGAVYRIHVRIKQPSPQISSKERS